MKILVVRFSSIGDIVLTSSVVRCLKNQVQNGQIHVLTKEQFTPLYDANPHLDKIYSLTDNWGKLISELKAENYDCIIDLHNNLRTKRLKLALGKQSYSFPKRNIKKYLLARFKWNLLSEKEHVVNRYFKAVEKIGVINDNQPNEFFINEENEIDLSSTSIVSKNYLAFAIGAQFATKKLPFEKLIAICDRVQFPIVLLGDKKDALVADELISKSTNKALYSFCGKFNIQQSASILKQAKVVLSHDTGLMHIAACFSAPIVTIWGNTTPIFGMSAYTPIQLNQSVNVEVEDISCRPCSKIGYTSCPKNHFNCMNLQDVEKINNIIAVKMSEVD
ncbi:MAG: glycosyltransferase family 9 protein [Bacteroidetes bacterium]|nr:glycosyltransferase family 9 protein [Bacteroidota bacterium]